MSGDVETTIATLRDAARSMRSGTTPATESKPYYDWNQDLVGTRNAVDEQDLTQLVNRYGGRP